MARFQYKMQNILNIKEKIEEQKRLELGKAMTTLQMAKEKKSEILGEIEQRVNVFKEQQKEHLNVLDFQRLNNNISYYRQALVLQEKVVIKAVQIVDLKRGVLRKALEERKIQEKLREKAYEVFMEEEKSKEQIILNESVGYRYATKKSDD